ncbi:MAG TPA: tetratricopeptide repeat protein [Bryobacteraceae bacterium]|nr:tetratricopeptide repeat protein [Bryobacteraceae bacterium]
MLAPPASFGQTPSASDKAGAYYNFALGHYYAEQAAAYGNRGDFYSKAVDYYKQALKLDPSASFLLEELTDLYVQGNQLKSAISEAEEILRQNPDNLAARRMLGRIYTRSIGDSQQGKINEEMVRKSIEQYQIITSRDPKDLDGWLTLGRLQRVAQNSVEAEKAFKKALERDANNEDALTGLAMVYSDVGDAKNMVEMLKRVTDKSPNERSLTTLGAAYEQMRDYASAAEVFTRALALKPENAQIKKALAQNLKWTGKYDKALELYKQLAEADPKDVQAHLGMSEIYRQKKMFDQSRAALAKAKELDSDNIEIRYDEVNLLEAEGKGEQAIAALKGLLDDTARKSYNTAEKASRTMLLERLAGLYRDAHQYPKAIEALRQIGEIDPSASPRVAANIVETYRAAKDFPAALAEADAAVKKYPKDRVVKVVHASLLADMGKVDQGAAEIRELLSGDKDRETYLTLAQIYEKGKNFDEMGKALDAAEKLSERKQEKESIYFMRGAMYEKMKKYANAEAEFRKVLDVNPQNAGALNYLGYMLADRNVRLEEASQMIRKALEIDPDNGAYLDSLGWVNFRMDKLDEAEKNLRLSIERVNGDPTVYDHLGDVYLKQGKVKDAIAQWQQSLKEWEKTPQSETDPDEVAKVTRKLEGARVRLARESGAPEKR